MANEANPEHLLDVFRTAALSVTKLYKSSVTAQAKARAEGYQDCLDDLLSFLDKEDLGLTDGEGWKVRAWANERLDNRDLSPQATESDDETEKQDNIGSPQIHRSSSTASLSRSTERQAQPQTSLRIEVQEKEDDASEPAPIAEEVVMDEPEVVVPSQETFDFRSSHPYPQDAHTNLNLSSLRLSDNSRQHDLSTSHSTPRKPTRRHGVNQRRPARISNFRAAHLGPGAGTKRNMDYEEFLELANLKGSGGPDPKRRHF
ncbi:hypothetical protein N0V82_009804 [Gnomoniopsis sp. IMI 355080]|nr:hypothetical protein N0V82_009804 [Gnomoniopsis sp. IMI 355080]